MKGRRYRLGLGATSRHSRFVREALEAAGWRQTGGFDWRLWWSGGVPAREVYRQRRDGQIINHFWGIGAITGKSSLARLLDAARRRLAPAGLEQLVDIAPRTFVLPGEYAAWRETAAREPGTIWIRKPAAGARGEGITLIVRPEEVKAEAGWVVQEYLARPHLLDDRKYTIRLYVLVTSLDPLLVYLYDDGLVKLAARPFTTDPGARQDRFVHLTNPDVLKHDPTHVVSIRNTTHAPYRERLRAAGADPDRLWRDIRRIVAVTMMAARQSILDRMRRESIDPTNTFELLGFDVLVDAGLRPWLLECNLGPSLAVEADETAGISRDEAVVKGRLVADALRLAGVTAEDGVTDGGAQERAAAEAARCGGFHRIVPSPEAAAWMPAFEALRPSDLAVLRASTREAPDGWPRLVPNGVGWHTLEDGLLLYDTRRERLAVFGPAGALAWLAAIDGVDPESIARELAGRLGGDFEPLADSVWETVGGWIHQGWLAAPPVTGRPESPAAATTLPSLDRDAGPVYALDGWRFIVRGPGEPHDAWIRPALAHLRTPDAPSAIDGAFAIRAADGWVVVDDEGRETPCGEPLGVLPALFREVERRAARARGGRLAFRASVAQRGDRSIVLLDPIDWPELIEALRAGGWSVHPRERLLLVDDPMRLVRFGDPSGRDLAVRALVPSLVRRADAATITPIGSVAALAALLAADIDLTTWLDARAAGAFAAWFDRLTRAVVTSGEPAEAASLLAGLLGAGEPSQASS